MTPEILNDLAAVNRFMSITRKQIVKYIPYKPGSNPCTSFQILVNIYCNPKLTATGIKRLRNSFSYVVDHNLLNLIECGLISTVNRPRRITQINAWKCERAYVVTLKGEKAISGLFEGIYGGRTEINHKKAS